MVASTSTKGTCATTAPQSSGSVLATTPISSPPAEPPSIAIRPGAAKPAATSPRATSTKSWKVFHRLASLPSRYQP